MESETITKVLYPNDEAHRGKELRLKQQFFFSSCSLQDMLRIHALLGGTPATFHEKWAVQLNDTHPAVAVAELMRLLVDEHALGWDEAWEVTRATFAYTNHTLLPEALEKWTVDLFGTLLPRHLEIVFEINRRFLDEVRAAFPGDDARLARLSLIDESGPRYVRMANLASVGSHTINGVAELHSELLKQTVLRDFAELWPDKFCNVTNGVTPRRFVALSNPGLTQLITARIGDGWLQDLDQLRQLEPLADDDGVPAAVARREAREQAPARRAHRGAHRHHGRAGVALRRAGEAHPRIQAAAPRRAPHPHALPAAQARSAGRRARAHLHLRRQSRARLFHGQAHHQAHHRHRRPREQRPRRARPAEGRLLPRLQREERALHLSRRRFVRANLHRGQGSERHGQHEVFAQRRAHHRHARRRECRDPRGSRRGEFLPLRPHRRRGRGGESRAAIARAITTSKTPSCAK